MNNTSNSLTKNPRIDVRKRNLDYSKQLNIVKNRDDLKKLEYANFSFWILTNQLIFCFRNAYHDDIKDDEVERLTSLIQKKKADILIPEIVTTTTKSDAANK